MSTLVEIIEKYGSDKFKSGYTEVYEIIFKEYRDRTFNYLEIGLGTLDPSIPSTFVGNVSLYEHYRPAGILRAWKEYFSSAFINGIDVAPDCMIEEDRIKTFLGSSNDSSFVRDNFDGKEFEIILDDGLHTADGQYLTFKNFFDKVTPGGLYIIEDIGGGGDGENVFDKYNSEILNKISDHEYCYRGNLLVIRKNSSKAGNLSFSDFTSNNVYTPTFQNNQTIVTGLWNINRTGRSFDHYLANLDKFLQIPQNLFIYVPAELEDYVRSRRSESNTFIKVTELEDIKRMYEPFWDRTQSLRTDPNWVSQAGWLRDSPQASLEWYNPIVQSKMFWLNDASIWNPFDTEYFYWLDAGITNTVPSHYFIEENVLNKLKEFSNPFLFLSYPYQADTEIHGFTYDKINEYSNAKVEYVCRGGLFGGHKQQINKANATYYGLLDSTLSNSLMGTEESLFTIMSYLEPDVYRRYELDGNGLVSKFTQALIDNTVTLAEPTFKRLVNSKEYTDRDILNVKTNLYMLTFNFPEQILHTIESMKKTPEWLEKPKLYLLDNSTNTEAKIRNQEIAKEYNFEYIDLGGNTGICGGRQAAAEHFDKSDADFMFFFEDDMTSNPPELQGEYCRNGLRKYVPNLYNIVHKAMLKHEFDFLKLSFTEVYFDNDKQCSWYNVPQDIRTRDWPNYDKLPATGLDPNCPRTNFGNIHITDDVAYITGEIYYANWPMIVSKEGNKKMFIDTKWEYPYEQTWMSHIYQLTKEDKIRPAVLLASPIWHDRIKHYEPEERREN